MEMKTCLPFVFSAILVTSGCVNPLNVEKPSNRVAQESTALPNPNMDAFLLVFDHWQGAPYRLGGSSLNGIDCSAFVQVAYQDAKGVNLPRTTKDQSKIGQYVEYAQARGGDLVFFKTGFNTRHVGIYLGNKQFMHASTSKGVIISRVDNPYWASKFWQFRRVTYSPMEKLN